MPILGTNQCRIVYKKSKRNPRAFFAIMRPDCILAAMKCRLFVLLILASAAQAGEKTFDPMNYPPTPDGYARLASEIDTHFNSGVLKIWFPRCVDNINGGFTPGFNEDWTPSGGN